MIYIYFPVGIAVRKDKLLALDMVIFQVESKKELEWAEVEEEVIFWQQKYIGEMHNQEKEKQRSNITLLLSPSHLSGMQNQVRGYQG